MSARGTGFKNKRSPEETLELIDRHSPGPQNLGNCPRLSNTSAGREGRIAIKDFAERSETVRGDLRPQRLKKALRRFAASVNTQMCQHKGSE